MHSQTPTLDEIHEILDKALAPKFTPSERLAMRAEIFTAGMIGILEITDVAREIIKEL